MELFTPPPSLNKHLFYLAMSTDFLTSLLILLSPSLSNLHSLYNEFQMMTSYLKHASFALSKANVNLKFTRYFIVTVL